MWLKYILIASFVLEALGYWASIGKERKPITVNLAGVQTIINALFIWGLMTQW